MISLGVVNIVSSVRSVPEMTYGTHFQNIFDSIILIYAAKIFYRHLLRLIYLKTFYFVPKFKKEISLKMCFL